MRPSPDSSLISQSAAVMSSRQCSTLARSDSLTQSKTDLSTGSTSGSVSLPKVLTDIQPRSPSGSLPCHSGSSSSRREMYSWKENRNRCLSTSSLIWPSYSIREQYTCVSIFTACMSFLLYLDDVMGAFKKEGQSIRTGISVKGWRLVACVRKIKKRKERRNILQTMCTHSKWAN